MLSVPSGAGKSSFIERIIQECSDIVDIVTCTTRPQRKGESDGVPYYFLSEEEFRRRIEQGYFIEWAYVHGNLYGTPLEQVHANWDKGKTVILDVDIQGAKTFMNRFPKEARAIFIHPPSVDELRQRLLERDGQKNKDLELRIENARMEIAQSEEFHFHVVNDDFETSFAEFKKLLKNL